MYINRFLGRSLCFGNGLSVGFNWIRGNGQTSKTSALLLAYHPPKSITWLWGIEWNRDRTRRFRFSWWTPRKGSGYGSAGFSIPFLGGLSIRWQPAMWKDR